MSLICLGFKFTFTACNAGLPNGLGDVHDYILRKRLLIKEFFRMELWMIFGTTYIWYRISL